MLEGKAIKKHLMVLGTVLLLFYYKQFEINVNACLKISSGHALDSHFVMELLILESFEFAKKRKKFLAGLVN